MRSLALVMGYILFFTACGDVKVQTNYEKKKEKYTYDINENGCHTGKHSFKKKDDYCKALLNESLNRGCAQESRHQLHRDQCASQAKNN